MSPPPGPRGERSTAAGNPASAAIAPACSGCSARAWDDWSIRQVLLDVDPGPLRTHVGHEPRWERVEYRTGVLDRLGELAALHALDQVVQVAVDPARMAGVALGAVIAVPEVEARTAVVMEGAGSAPFQVGVDPEDGADDGERQPRPDRVLVGQVGQVGEVGHRGTCASLSNRSETQSASSAWVL